MPNGTRPVPQSLTVLIVDDSAMMRAMIKRVAHLTDIPIAQVLEAGNGVEALQQLENHAVDVLFTDINMPGEIDGAELAKEARNLRPDLPVVYASGRYTAGDLTPMVPRSLFLPKPYDPIDACTLLNRLAPAA